MLMIYRYLYPFFLLITGASTFCSPVGNVKRPSLSTTRSTYYNLLDGITTLLWMTEDDDDSINDSTWTGQEHLSEAPYPLNKYRKQFFQTIQCYYGNGDILHICILGTFHVWNQSAADVQLLLEVVQPDITLVELCPARFDAMCMQEMRNETEKNDEKQSGENRGVESHPTKSSSSIGGSRLERAALNSLVRMVDGMAEELDSKPADEFFTAYMCWKNQIGNSTSTSGTSSGGPNLFVLGDRPFEITWSRAWENLRKRDILWMLTPSKTSILLLGGLSSLLLFPGLVGLGLFGVAAPFVFAWLLMTTEEEGLREELEGLLFEGEDEVDGDDKAAVWLEKHKLPFPAVEDAIIRERDLSNSGLDSVTSQPVLNE